MSDPFSDGEEISDPAALATDPALSIVVTTYRHEPYLEQCIESLAAQKADFPFEILICDDNSPDGTRALARRLQARHSSLVRILFTAANKGGARNMLFGVSRCRAPLIAFCEGDDFWIDADKIARQVAAFRAHSDVDLAFTRGYRLTPDGARTIEWDYGEQERIVPLPELLAGFGWIAPTASLMFRAEALRNLPPSYGQWLWGDHIIILSGALRGGAHYDPTPTICYRAAHATSFTVHLISLSPPERIEFLEGAIHYWHLSCAFYGFPVRHVRHRIDDYRLSLAKLSLGEGQPLRALRAFAAISPMFLLRGLGRRLTRRLAG